MKNILVTGGAGFIGTNLIKRLKKEGHNITSIDSYISGKVTNHVEGVNYVKLNTKDFNKNNSLYYTNFDVVFHLGEYSRIVSSFDDINEVWLSNSLGTFNVIEYCKKNKIKLIYAGSSTKFAQEGIDHSPYSFTKSKSAELVKNYNKWFDLDYSICYFYNVFGEGYDSSPVNGYESVISVFEKQYKNGQPLTICGDGQQSRSFTYVGDIVDGLIKSWKYSKNGEFQLNNENTYTILEIAKMFSDNITFIPARKGDRLTSSTTNNNSREILNWETTKNVDEWIKEIKK
jgi:UDP-glucose 4-epimerase